MSQRSLLIAALAAVSLASCGPGPQPAPDVRAAADEQFNAFWDSATEVLREYRFTIDQTDRRSGLIATFPMVGQHWFEFWRTDAATSRDLLESSLHTIYRQARVTIRRAGPAADGAPGAGGCAAVVEVGLWRSDRPAAQVTSTSEAFEMFRDPSALVARPSPPQPSEGPSNEPVELGRDEKLEERIRQRIHALAAAKLAVARQ